MNRFEKQPFPTRDWLTQEAATEQAIQIHQYWLDRGCDLDVRVEPVIASGGRCLWCIRSNLVFSLPSPTKAAA